MKKRKCMCMIFIFFVAVQLLEDAPASLSLGKLCKEHGYTYEWPSGREPRLTKMRIRNFVPLLRGEEDTRKVSDEAAFV